MEGLSKNLCSTASLWEDYQIQQYANQIMCMNLQAEGMSNVLEHVVNAYCEVSKSPRARTKKGKCRNLQFHNVILKNPCSASVQPGGSHLPATDDHTVPELCENSALEYEQMSPVLKDCGLGSLHLPKPRWDPETKPQG